MRPVSKGTAYLYTDGSPYESARPGLQARLGLYCSYCERRLPTGLAVEHIQPKDIHKTLERVWSNFLLACVNCNSSKGTKDDALDSWLIPDRDNTFRAFEYRPDGIIQAHSISIKAKAEKTLEILDLNKKVQEFKDQNGNLVAWDRRTQRMESWALAKRYRGRWDMQTGRGSDLNLAAELIVQLALENGFFSIWMAAFDGVPEIRKRLIKAFPGTEAACFDSVTQAKSPHPNTDGLPDGGKL